MTLPGAWSNNTARAFSRFGHLLQQVRQIGLLALHVLLGLHQLQPGDRSGLVFDPHQVQGALRVGDPLPTGQDRLVEIGDLPVQIGRRPHQGERRVGTVLLGGPGLPFGGITTAGQLAP